MLEPDERPTPMRRVLALLLVSGLLFASTLAVAEPGRGQRDDGDADDTPRSQGRNRGGAVPLGAFTVEETSQAATGEHLAFTYSDDGIADFRALDRTLFDIQVEGQADDDDDGRGVRVEGSELRVRTPAYRFIAHDTPTAASKLSTDGQVHVLFEEGVVLARENGERVRFSYGDVTGVLRGDDLVLSGRNVTASDELLVVLDQPRGAGDQEHYRDLGRAIAKGNVGAEATLNLLENESVEEAVVSYGNVTMTTTRAERGNLTVMIEGHGFDGRVIVLNVDGRLLGADAADKLGILLDNETIEAASNLTDILDPDNDGYKPEYYVVFDPQAEAFQLIVTLPHYSVHVLSVTTAIVLPPPSVVLGVVAGVALLVPAALLLFRRK